MSREILINITPMETRVALVENGVPQEVAIERNHRRGLVGNIYKGNVVRVLPGMQAAFIDIGMDKAGFLHIDDMLRRDDEASSREISRLLQEGKQVLVQVMKDPIGTKGARLTTFLSISSRYLVYMSDSEHIGVSQRIEDEGERERLKVTLEEAIALEAESEPAISNGGGYILRTATDGASLDELRSDVRFLTRLWRHLLESRDQAQAPECIYEDLPLYKRVLRDMGNPIVEKVRVDSQDVFEALVRFANKFSPEIANSIEYYPGERPLFFLYGVEDEIVKALQRKVQLKSGGYLVIDQTEAMTTIDVNTGAFVGRRTLEETIYRTNLEAATAIARQLRMRNLGGIIIVDFIDMQEAEHRRQVLRTLEKALERDRVKTSISGVTELGLVQVTRKRTSESLEQLLCEPCPSCEGRGTLKSAETVSFEVLREILRASRAYECLSLRVLASPAVIDRLLDEESALVADLEALIGCTIQFRVENAYSQEQFDIIPA